MMTFRHIFIIVLYVFSSYSSIFSNSSADFERALYLIKEGELDKARQVLFFIGEEDIDIASASLDLIDAIDYARGDTYGLYRYGCSLLNFAIGDWTSTIDILKKTEFNEKLELYSMELLGRTYQKIGMWDDALDIYIKLYQIGGDDSKPWYLFYQWQIYILRGDDKRAKEIYDFLISNYPQFTKFELEK
ncbi:MAG: tetratricopeptide repeat protein [bacterium]